MYGSQTCGSCIAAGSFVRYPRLTPSKYDLHSSVSTWTVKIHGHTPLPGRITCQIWYLNLEVPELDIRNQDLSDEIKTRKTHNPTSILAVLQLLCICPLVQECIRRGKLCRQAPFYGHIFRKWMWSCVTLKNVPPKIRGELRRAASCWIRSRSAREQWIHAEKKEYRAHCKGGSSMRPRWGQQHHRIYGTELK